jgi:hypothetical protein
VIFSTGTPASGISRPSTFPSNVRASESFFTGLLVVRGLLELEDVLERRVFR